jgi:hypothetical protein
VNENENEMIMESTRNDEAEEAEAEGAHWMVCGLQTFDRMAM